MHEEAFIPGLIQIYLTDTNLGSMAVVPVYRRLGQEVRSLGSILRLLKMYIITRADSKICKEIERKAKTIWKGWGCGTYTWQTYPNQTVCWQRYPTAWSQDNLNCVRKWLKKVN